MRTLTSFSLCVSSFCLVFAAPASAHDLRGPDWRGLHPGYMTYQEWSFDDSDDPALPEVIINPFGTAGADITLGAFGEGWFESLSGYGSQTGFWDIGGEGGQIVLDIDNGPERNPWKEIWVQVTYWKDIQQAPTVAVPGGYYVGGEKEVLVEHVATGGDWLLDVWVFRIEPNPEHEQIVISSDPDWGSLIDQVVVDTWCVPEPATVSLLLLGGLVILARRCRK